MVFERCQVTSAITSTAARMWTLWDFALAPTTDLVWDYKLICN